MNAVETIPDFGDRYEILDVVGSGAQGAVYRARDLLWPERRLAVKVLRRRGDGDDSDQWMQLFRREFEVLAGLHHPRLSRVHDFGRTNDGDIFFTRDFFDGDDLMAHTAGISAGRLVGTVVEICRALRPLHRAGIVHADLKPGNIIVGPDRVARLIDFSFVASSGEAASGKGTGHYMSPEVIEGKTQDVRSDIYSLGAAVFEVVTGKPLFEGSARTVLAGHLGEDRPRAVSSRLDMKDESAEMGEEIARLIDRMVSRNPDDRFPDIEEVEAAWTGISSGTVDADPIPPLPMQASVLGGDEEVQGLYSAVTDRLENDSSRGALYVVEGEPGTGRSAALRAFKWRVQLGGGNYLEAGCSRQGGVLDPIEAIARQAAYLLADDVVQSARAGALLSRIAGPGGRTLDLEDLATAIGDLVSWASSRGPVVVGMDDADQVSEEALGILGGALARASHDERIAYVVTSRTDFGWREFLGNGMATVMPLLDREGVRNAVEVFFGNADEESIARVLDHTGGNPLFVNTLLCDLYAAGEGLARLERLGPPLTLESYWGERLDLLDGPSRSIVEAAAVIEAPADKGLLCIVSGVGADDLTNRVSRLVTSGWLRVAGDGWVISSVPVSRVIEELIPADRLAGFHRRAMDEETDEVRVLLHAAACEEVEVLETRGLEVAGALEKTGAYSTAARLYEAMDRVLGEGGVRSEYRVAMARVASAQGDHATAVDLLEPMARLDDLSVRRQVLVLLGEVHLLMRNLDEAAGALEQALEVAKTPIFEATVLGELASVSFRRGDLEGAAQLGNRGLGLVPDTHLVRADILGLLGTVSVSAKKHTEAIALCTSAVRVAAECQDRKTLALALDRLAWSHQQSGDLEAAVEKMVEAARLYREIGDFRRLMRAHQAMGDLYWWQERLSDSLAQYEEANRLVGLVGSAAQALGVHIALGWALNTVGRFERAGLVLGGASSEAERLGLEEPRFRALAFKGDNNAWQGKVSEALTCWEEAREGLDALGRSGICAELELEMAEARLWRRGPRDLDEARLLIDAARSREREELGRRFEEVLALVEGIEALASGGLEAGIAKLDTLIDELKERGSRDIAWQAHLAVGRDMAERGADVLARKRLRQAEEILIGLASGLPEQHRLAFWQDVRRAEVRRLLSITVPSSKLNLALGGVSEERSDGPDSEAAALYRVLEFNKRLSTETDLDRLMEAILDAAIELTGAERGFVLMPSSDGLQVRAVRETGAGKPRDAHEKFSKSIAESVFLDGEAVVTVDATGDDRFSDFISIHELQVRSVACVPVNYRSNTQGVLYLENRLRRGRFDIGDLRVLSAFSDQVAIAIAHARLLDEARTREQELSEASRAMEDLCARQAEDLRLKKTDLKLVEERFERVRQRVDGQGDYNGIIGTGEGMRRVFDMMERVKDLDVPVVFVGESGTGKDLMARVLHDIGARRLGPFVAVACGGIPEGLVEATLFGHTKGAFSGAENERPGLVASAAGGTLYLDDIGEIPPRMQIDLLRVLQEGCYTPLGGNAAIRADFRLVASSRENPEDLVARGMLRQDLYYRLQVLAINLPPLRERPEDLPYLARRIMIREANRLGREPLQMSSGAVESLASKSWPGNVRELEQVIRRALVIADGGGVLTAETLFGEPPPPAISRGRKPVKRDAEEEQKILDALESCQWNRSQAAKLLGIPRRTFYRRLNKMGLMKKQ